MRLNAEQRALLKRLDAARSKAFPEHTDPCSRHAAMIGEHLLRGKPYTMLTGEAQHCGESILYAIAALWETRLALAEHTDSAKARKD